MRSFVAFCGKPALKIAQRLFFPALRGQGQGGVFPLITGDKALAVTSTPAERPRTTRERGEILKYPDKYLGQDVILTD